MLPLAESAQGFYSVVLVLSPINATDPVPEL
jgi:hypothetical protein